MAIEALVDNDVLIKAACYDLLRDLLPNTDQQAEVGLIGVARFAVGSRLERDQRIRRPKQARRRWMAFLTDAAILEPTPDEVDLATEIEEAAREAQVPVDVGESQLAAVAIVRTIQRVITGDKRAIRGLETILERVEELSYLAGRVECLEQVLATVLHFHDFDVIRERICAEPEVDRVATYALVARPIALRLRPLWRVSARTLSHYAATR